MKNEKQTMSQMLKTRAWGIRMSKPGQQERRNHRQPRNGTRAPWQPKPKIREIKIESEEYKPLGNEEGPQ